MKKYLEAISCCIISFGFYYLVTNFHFNDIEEHAQYLAMVTIVGYTIYNEIKQHRHFSILDLVSMREEVHQLAQNQAVIAVQMEQYVPMTDFLQHQLEMSNAVKDAVNGAVTEIKENVNIYLNAIHPISDESEYDEEEEVEEELPAKVKAKKAKVKSKK